MKIWELGDFIDTDLILPAKYLNNNDPEYYSKFCLENGIVDFSKSVKKGDIIVAGEFFGYGSSRESAPFAIKYLGIQAIFAKSFGRIFMRNAINIGLPVIEIDEGMKREIIKSEKVYFDDDFSKFTLIRNGQELGFKTRYTNFLQSILKDEGLMKYYEKHYGEKNFGNTR